MRKTLALLLCLLPTICFAQHGGGGGFSGGGGGGFGGGRGGGNSDPRFGAMLMAFMIVGIVGIFAWADYRSRIIGFLKITTIPPGEAPEEIRSAWVGAVIPLRRIQSQPVTKMAIGVLSQTKTGRTTGYALMGSEAIRALERHNPKAAQWWRDHAGHVLVPGYVLIFPTDVCAIEPLPKI